MSWNENNIVAEAPNSWGGPWTDKKLDAFAKYVRSYLKIMKNFPYWKTIYFDGFAGSGTREKKEHSNFMEQLQITDEEENVYQGAAERVLNIEHYSFDYYYFIDKNKESIDQLGLKLKEQFPNKCIENRNGDANFELKKLAKALRTKKYAALVFLDPFGMQIDWSSIAELKDTRSDVWILVPTGVIVNRLLDRAGSLKNSSKLESFFGLSAEEIKKHFYSENVVENLFGEEEEIITKVSQPIKKIAQLYAQRLKTIWSEVTMEPLVLKNSKGSPIFHFVFASNNKNAARIAKDIIEKL